MKVCIAKIKDITNRLTASKVFNSLEEAKQLLLENKTDWEIKLDTATEFIAENVNTSYQVFIKEVETDLDTTKNLAHILCTENAKELAEKKSLSTPERLETIQVIEYILDNCAKNQLEIISNCILKHFDQICEDYEEVIKNVQKQKQDCNLRIQEKSIYLYNVLVTIIGKEMGRL